MYIKLNAGIIDQYTSIVAIGSPDYICLSTNAKEVRGEYQSGGLGGPNTNLPRYLYHLWIEIAVHFISIIF
jgi:hypothetical protein